MAGVFTLEALDAAHGDALILHYGPASRPRVIVIDGGPAGVFATSLFPRLEAIRAARGGGPLELRMVMVSHIDDDHIVGILEFAKHLQAREDSGEAPGYDVLTLWHNSFDDIAGRVTEQVKGSVVASLLLGAKPKTRDGAALVASVKQGRELRVIADRLGWNMNTGFDDLLVFDSAVAGPLNMGADLRFTVLGPRQAELDALNRKWDREVTALLAKKKAKKDATPAELQALAAEFVDTSIHNLSSVVVLAEFEGRRILLTGDARGDFVLQSLDEAGLLTGGTIDVDVFKVPHHGSIRNAARELFEAVRADHYVFSADGTNGNPDPPTFDLLFKARPTGRYHLWMTNHVAKAVTRIKAKKPAGVTLHVRKAAELSVRVELATPIAW